MAENPTPRQMARDLLQGIAPPRPLLLPIIFSLGARVENLPLRIFLSNPTKICNAQRQIRGRLPADAVTCYFDPYLEAESLGAVLRWSNDDQPPSVCWAVPALRGELPPRLRSPEEAVKAGRIPIAAEVIRRLASLLRDDVLLMAGVSGPFTLAARLLQWGEQDVGSADDVPAAACEVAASMLTQVASALAEAGANVILICEDILPRLSADSCDDWATRLSPAINIIRFYGALPVLLLTNPVAVSENSALLATREWEAILCPAVQRSSLAQWSSADAKKIGLALPPDRLSTDRSLFDQIVQLRPALVTTAGDVSLSTDVKQLAAIFAATSR